MFKYTQKGYWSDLFWQLQSKRNDRLLFLFRDKCYIITVKGSQFRGRNTTQKVVFFYGNINKIESL